MTLPLTLPLPKPLLWCGKRGGSADPPGGIAEALDLVRPVQTLSRNGWKQHVLTLLCMLSFKVAVMMLDVLGACDVEAVLGACDVKSVKLY